MKALYTRISTSNQNIERQLRKGFDKVFIDICSGSIPFDERPEGIKLKNDPDITSIQIEDVDRLGRKLSDVVNQMEYFTEKGIDLYIERHGLHTMVNGKKNPVAELIVSILGSVYQMESNYRRDRTEQGISIAKAKGKFKGKKRGSTTSIEKTRLRHAKIIPIANSYRENGVSWLGIEKRLKESGFVTANRITLKRLHELKLIN
jgi:DNA invertase Pin-like site-specific DNA recombinase